MFASNRGFVAVITAACAFAGTGSVAAPMPKEGSFDFNFCLSGRTNALQVSESLMGGSFEATAGIYSNVAGGAFDGQGSHCLGTWAVVDGKYSDSGYCMTTDADGDRFLMDFRTGPLPAGQPARGKWVVAGGSGKYAGMSASGEYKGVLQSSPAIAGGFQGCNRNTGTYKLK